MKLPHRDRAFIDTRKLEGYCLNSAHPRGKHKARVFRAVLGLKWEDSGELKRKILGAIQVEECTIGLSDAFGDRYIVDFNWNKIGEEATIRTAWMVRKGENYPRLSSCFVLPKE